MIRTFFCGHCEGEFPGVHAGYRSDGRPLCGRCCGPRPEVSGSASAWLILLASAGLLLELGIRAGLWSAVLALVDPS